MNERSNSLADSLVGVPRHLLKGFCMGSADIIPGVSGGTMALILGIYERLLKAIGSFNQAWLNKVIRMRLREALAGNDLPFLLPLVTGIGLALLFFTRVVPLPRLIVTDPEPVYGLFFGLILASIVILVGEVRKYGPVEIALTLAGVLAGLAVVNLVPVETPTAPWFIYLCGFVAISAMLLPGISGSFILLILGKYAFIIDAIGHFDVLVILAFALGALSGLVVFSRTIVWLLERFHQGTLLVIKGILIGSLWMIWPFQDRVYEVIGGREKLVGARPVWPEALTGSVVLSLSLALAGFVAVMLIHRFSDSRKNPRPEPGTPR
jgi:putative membrane protein